MARPRLDPADSNRVTLSIKISQTTSDALARIAKINGMASSQYVRSLVTQHIHKAQAYSTSETK